MQAYHKSQKAALIKKSKLSQQKLTQEKLARRNPARIERQIAELKTLEEEHAGVGGLRAHEKAALKKFEEELGRVRRARKALGIVDEEKKEGSGSGRGRGTGEGREMNANKVSIGPGRGMGRRGNDDGHESDSSTASSVAEIPLPEGSPPPVQSKAHELPLKPEAPKAVTTYEAKPVVRDLRREAAAFVPMAVKRRLVAVSGSSITSLSGTTNTTTTTTEGGEKGGEGVGGMGAVTLAAGLGLGLRGINAAPEIGGKVEGEVDEEYERFRGEMGMDFEGGEEIDEEGDSDGGGDI